MINLENCCSTLTENLIASQQVYILSVLSTHLSWSCWKWPRSSFTNKVQYNVIFLEYKNYRSNVVPQVENDQDQPSWKWPRSSFTNKVQYNVIFLVTLGLKIHNYAWIQYFIKTLSLKSFWRRSFVWLYLPNLFWSVLWNWKNPHVMLSIFA